MRLYRPPRALEYFWGGSKTRPRRLTAPADIANTPGVENFNFSVETLLAATKI